LCNCFVFITIRRIPRMANPFGRINYGSKQLQSFKITLKSAILLKVFFSNIEVLKKESYYCGAFILGCFQYNVYSHVLLSFNRFCAIYFPLYYGKIFTPFLLAFREGKNPERFAFARLLILFRMLLSTGPPSLLRSTFESLYCDIPFCTNFSEIGPARSTTLTGINLFSHSARFQYSCLVNNVVRLQATMKLSLIVQLSFQGALPRHFRLRIGLLS
uniref:7TM_GPCR_Srx domain-containing protein n=1 Tax=Haemonchus placei TaxID=6290 RepID=A0A0N4WUP1_HAEPC